MKTPSTPAIAVDELRIGMFVHLDVGWMSHPFALSSFRITTPGQLATIHKLGLKKVRWSPDLSRLDPGDSTPAGSAEAAALEAEAVIRQAVEEESAAEPIADISVPADDAPAPAPEAADSPAVALDVPTGSAGAAPAPSPAAGTVPAVRPEPADTLEAARASRRAALTAQREAAALCERQFAEATRDCRRIFDASDAEPLRSGSDAALLGQALLDKMLGEQDLCIRLLSEGAGDRASAHAVNVTVISLLMGRTFGFADEDMLDLGVGALLHDIGKLDLPDRVRHREDHFTAAEARFYEEHVAHGVTRARRMVLTPGATLVIAGHHECADGSGFPLRVSADRMPLAARIVALVNRYDNLCNAHVPSRSLTPHESLSLLFAQGQSKFDTAILGAFIKMMGVYPPGSAVQLTDDRYALVVGVNASRPLKPRVLVHDPAVPSDEALIVDLQHAGGVGIRRSIKPLALPRESLEYLSPRSRVVYFFEPATAGDNP